MVSAPADPEEPASSQVTEAEKAKRRAERFGIAVVPPSGSAGPAPEDKERLKKRAERFGLPPPIETEEVCWDRWWRKCCPARGDELLATLGKDVPGVVKPMPTLPYDSV